MRRRRVPLVLILVPLGPLVVLFGPMLMSETCHYDGAFCLHVTGRLVDSRTGQPVGGAHLMSYPIRAWASGEESDARYRLWSEESETERDSAQARGAPLPLLFSAHQRAAGQSASDGSFDLLVKVPWSYNTIVGIRTGSSRPPEGKGARARQVEVKGREPQFLDIEYGAGKWREATEDDELWATWDLGQVKVQVTD